MTDRWSIKSPKTQAALRGCLCYSAASKSCQRKVLTMHHTTAISLGLLNLALLWSYGYCSPVALPGSQDDGPSLSYNPGGPILPTDTPLSYNPGGPMISASSMSVSVNPGGPILPKDTSLSFNPGGPMEPWTPVLKPTPTQTPMSVQPGGRMKPPHRQRGEDPQATSKPGLTGTSCTWTVSVTATNPCSWNGIETIYPATATSTSYIDCHGCPDLELDMQIWHCPNEIITATKVVQTPRTIWGTTCATASITGHPSVVTSPLMSPTWAPAAVPEVERGKA